MRQRQCATITPFCPALGDAVSQWREGPFRRRWTPANLIASEARQGVVLEHQVSAEHRAWGRAVAQEAVAARCPHRRDGARLRDGLAPLPLAGGLGREPRDIAWLHRRPHARQSPRFRRALCCGGGAVAAGRCGADLGRRLSVRLAVGRGGVHRRRHHGRVDRVSHRPKRARRIPGGARQVPGCLAFARAFRTTPSAICCSSGWCRFFPSGWSTSPRRCSASASPPMSPPPSSASSREPLPIRWPAVASTASSGRSKLPINPALPRWGRGAKVLPVYARSRGAFDTGTGCRTGGAGPGGAHSGGGQMVPAQARLSRVVMGD